MNKKGQGLPLNAIIIAVIVLIVLVVIVAIFTGQFGAFGTKLEAKEEAADTAAKVFTAGTAKLSAACGDASVGITPGNCADKECAEGKAITVPASLAAGKRCAADLFCCAS